MRRKPVFVSYIYMRECRNNPSIERFYNLPALEQERLWARLEKPAKHKTNIVRFVKRKRTA